MGQSVGILSGPFQSESKRWVESILIVTGKCLVL